MGCLCNKKKDQENIINNKNFKKENFNNLSNFISNNWIIIVIIILILTGLLYFIFLCKTKR